MKFFSRIAGLLLIAAFTVTPLLAQKGPNPNPGQGTGKNPVMGTALPTDVKGLAAAIKDPKDTNVYQCIYALAQMNDPEGNAVLIEQLKVSKSSKVRQSISSALAMLKNDEGVVDALIAAAKDPDPGVRGGVFYSLCSIGNPKGLPSTIAYINAEQDTRAKNRLYSSIASFGAAAIDPLLAILQTADAQVKPRIVQALAATRDNRAIEPLLEAYNEGDTQAKTRLIYSMVNFISNSRVMDTIMESVKSKDIQISRAAINMVVGQNDPAMVAPLLNTYHDIPTESKVEMLRAINSMPDPRFTTCILAIKDTDENVRAQAATTLGLLQNERAIGPLKNLLEKDTSKNVKIAAAYSLSQMGTEGISDVLIGMLDDTDVKIKEKAIRTLALMKEKKAARKIATMLNDPDLNIKNAAFYAMGMIKDPSTVKVVGQMLAAGDNQAKIIIARTLGEIGDVKATEFLLPLLNEQDYNLKSTAIKSLGDIKSVESAPVLLVLMDEKTDNPQQQWQVNQMKNSVFYALGNIAEPATVPILIDNAIIKETAGSAIFALRTMGKIAAPALIEALNGDNFDKKQVAINVIGGTGAQEAEPALTKIADNKANLVSAIAAVRALGELKTNGANVADLDKYLDMLTEGAKSPDQKMINDAIRAIGMIKSDKAVGVLAELKKANPQLSNQVYQALGNIATPMAVNTLIIMKNDATDINVKNQIIFILGRYGNASAIASLTEDLNVPALKSAAQSAIRLLSGEVDEKTDATSGKNPRGNAGFYGGLTYQYGDALTNATAGGGRETGMAK